MLAGKRFANVQTFCLTGLARAPVVLVGCDRVDMQQEVELKKITAVSGSLIGML